MKFLLIAAVCLFLSHHADSATIKPSLRTTFKSQKTANIVVNMRERTSQVLHGVKTRAYTNRAEKINAVVNALQRLSSNSQKSVKAFLHSQNVAYKSFWISNQIFIEAASQELTEKLATMADIAEIAEEMVVQIEEPIDFKISTRSRSAPKANQWGVEIVEAHLTWTDSDGRGIVVGGIDTGVRATHEVLRRGWRSNYGWLDPTANIAEPYDNNGHGTHTVGSICGADGYGVAPGAQWIGCKGCAATSCSYAHLAACGEFMLCPTRPNGTDPDCSQAPDVVSNSWGGTRGDSWYDYITEAWIAADIIPVFSIGNSGPGCSTDLSPGDRNVIGVGATTSVDALATFSSRGPAVDGKTKPEVSAPGQNINSAYHLSDTSYSLMSGTSMACPHAAGVVALILSANRLNFEQVKQVLEQNVDTAGLTPPQTNCGGISDNVYPNNAFGFGRVNARKSVQAALAM